MLMLLFGIREMAKVMLIFVGTFSQLVVAAGDEIRRVPHGLPQVGYTLGARCGEAIYLSTRILAFSARPGSVVCEIRVPVGATRTLDIKLTPEFVRHKREIIDLLHQTQHNGFDREQLLRKLVENRIAAN
jgi:hypothetical protein